MIQLPGFYGNTATEAIRTAAARRILPTWLGSADLAQVAQQILDRAVFSARTTNAIYLEALRERISRLLSDGYEGDQAQLRLELKQILVELGYDPEFGFPGDEELGIPPARPGSLQDLSSDARINLILETQLELMAGKGQEQRGLQPEALDLFPAWELVRLRPVRMPRDWPKRWEKAGGRALVDVDGRLRLAAGKLDEIWSLLGDKAIFRDALGVSHPPFCFRSGMGWEPIEADAWDALLKQNGRRSEATAQELPPSAKGLPPAVVSTDGLSDETLAKLKLKLEGVEAKGGKLTLGGIITTPPPPPPPSRLRRLNALRDAVLCVAMVAEVNGRYVKGRESGGKGRGKRGQVRAVTKQPGQRCGRGWIAAGLQCGKQASLLGEKGSSESLGLPSLKEQGQAAMRASRVPLPQAIKELRSGFEVRSPLGIVEADRVIGKHTADKAAAGDYDRARWIDKARMTLMRPLEVWQSGLDRFYLATFQTGKGHQPFLVKTHRTGEAKEKIISFHPREWGKIDKDRVGELLHLGYAP